MTTKRDWVNLVLMAALAVVYCAYVEGGEKLLTSLSFAAFGIVVGIHGNKIILSPDPKGVKLEGTISGTPSPGTVLEVMANALINGRPKYRVFQPGTDGLNRCQLVLLANPLNGSLQTDAYADGDHCFIYVPHAGEEMNMLIADVAGTGDTHAIGDLMIVKSGTGKLIVTTGSPASTPYVLLEPETVAPTADSILMCMFTGY